MTVFVRQEDVDELLAAYNANDKGPTHKDTVTALHTMIQNASVDYDETKKTIISVFLKDLMGEIDPSFKDVIQIDGYCPLTNVGNSCYINATIQMLYSIPELRTFFTKINDTTITPDKFKSLNDKGENKLSEDMKKEFANLIKAFGTLFKHFKTVRISTPSTPVSITTLKIDGTQIYTLFINSFKDEKNKKAYTQNDAAEFIHNILQPMIDFTDMKSIIELFSIKDQEQITCENKTQITKDRTPINSIELEIKKNINRIQLLLDNIQTPESLIDSNLESCGDGTSGNKGKATTKQNIYSIPSTTKYLLISLTRFNQTEKDFVKTAVSSKSVATRIDTPITPDKIIKLPTYVAPSTSGTPPPTSFQLKGCICHGGDTGGGHYWYILCKDGIPYLKLDDSTVSKVNPDYDLTVSGYIYLYERVNTPATPPPAVGGARTTRKHARSRVHAPTRKSSRSLPQTWEADKGESQTELL